MGRILPSRELKMIDVIVGGKKMEKFLRAWQRGKKCDTGGEKRETNRRGGGIRTKTLDF